MKFKSFDEFKPIYEEQTTSDKFTVRTVSPKNANGEVAYVVKFIGKTFDTPTLIAFIKNNEQTKSITDKIMQLPQQYFVAYTTMKDAEERAFSRNSTWKVFIELINAKKGPKPSFVGFNQPPYNNYVDYQTLDQFISPDADPNDPAVKSAKESTGSIDSNPNIGSNNTMAANEVPEYGSTATQTVTQTETPVATPVAPPIDPNVPKVVDPNAPKVVDPSQAIMNDMTMSPVSGTSDQIADSFVKLKLNDRGNEVKALQKTIELIARATNKTSAMKSAGRNIKSDGSGSFDGIYGPETAQGLGEILGKGIVNGPLDPESLMLLKKLMKDNNISSDDLNKVTLDQAASKKALGKSSTMTPKGITANTTGKVDSGAKQITKNTKPTGAPVAKSTSTPGAPVAKSTSTPGAPTTFVNTRIGKIYYA